MSAASDHPAIGTPANSNGAVGAASDAHLEPVCDQDRVYHPIPLEAQAAAVTWLRHGCTGADSGRHSGGCACERCRVSRILMRAAIEQHGGVECSARGCPACWARREVLAGRM